MMLRAWLPCQIFLICQTRERRTLLPPLLQQGLQAIDKVPAESPGGEVEMRTEREAVEVCEVGQSPCCRNLRPRRHCQAIDAREHMRWGTATEQVLNSALQEKEGPVAEGVGLESWTMTVRMACL